MAKFFNEDSGNVGNNRFFNNQYGEESQIEEDAPNFVSVSDASLMAQQEGMVPKEEVEEVYSGETNGLQDFSMQQNGNAITSFEEAQTSYDQGPSFSNYQEEYVDMDEGEETVQQGYENNSFEQMESQYNEEPQIQEQMVEQPMQFIQETPKEQLVQEQLMPQVSEEVVEEAPVEEVIQAEVDEKVEEKPIEEDLTSSKSSDSQLTNIEESEAFTNIETSFVVDNSYKGVDNTGKTGEDIKNPVYIDALEKNDVNVSGNILAVLLVLFEVLLSPGKSVIRNTEKYVKGKKAFKVFMNVVIYEFIFSIVGHVIAGCFVNKMTYGDYKKVLDFSNVFNLNYINIILSSLIVIFGFVMLLALINYASSFFSNKGLAFNTYLLIASLSFFPLVLAINTLAPLFNVISLYLAIGVVMIAFVYSFLIYTNALWGIMEFKNDNGKVFYLLLNFILITAVIVIILLVFFEDYVNAIKVVFK